jgi:hypothetical protein
MLSLSPFQLGRSKDLLALLVDGYDVRVSDFIRLEDTGEIVIDELVNRRWLDSWQA